MLTKHDNVKFAEEAEFEMNTHKRRLLTALARATSKILDIQRRVETGSYISPEGELLPLAIYVDTAAASYVVAKEFAEAANRREI